jgi:hypothetical protein
MAMAGSARAASMTRRPRGRSNWRRRQLERVERREVVHTRETFGEFFPRWLTRRKPYLEDGSWSCYERDGRIRLLPALESVALGVMEVEHVRDLMDVMTEGMGRAPYVSRHGRVGGCHPGERLPRHGRDESRHRRAVDGAARAG